MNESFEPICELDFTELYTGKKVTVRLGPPVYDPMQDWYCLSEMTGIEEGIIQRVYGVDPFQALCMALKRFRVLFAKYEGDFRTTDGSAPCAVFPKEIPWVYGSDVYRRLCNMVDDEIRKIEDERTQRFEGGDRTAER